jgi:hypothetical protein
MLSRLSGYAAIALMVCMGVAVVRHFACWAPAVHSWPTVGGVVVWVAGQALFA